MQPDALAMSITQSDGRVYRWGGDEPDSGNVPQGLTFGTSIPGGNKDLSANLARRIDLDYPDQALFDDIKVYGPGGEEAWSGRQIAFPRSHGDAFSIQANAVGHAAHLKDDTSFREVYVDRDLSHWTQPSAQRRINIAAASRNNADFQIAGDPTTGAPALITQLVGAWGRATVSEAYYDAGAGVPLGSLYYAWTRGDAIVLPNANWELWAGLSATDATPLTDNSGNIMAAGPGTGTVTATTATRRFAALQLMHSGSGGDESRPYPVYFTCLASFGTHALTKQGTASATAAQGFYASDVIANVVSRAAPLLNYTTGAAGSIQPTSFVIPQLAFLDPTTAEDAILKTNAYHLYEWGVYEDKTFFYRPADSSSPGRPGAVTWEARLSDGAQLDLEGDQADDVYNGVIVHYQEPDGTRKIVGPPGSGFDATDPALLDTSADNPVNAHGIPKRWAVLELSFVTTSAGAIQIGAIYLAEKGLPARRGSMVVKDTIKHPTAGPRPVWAVRAGDYVLIPDHPVDVPRRIIETRYTHDPAPSVVLTLDNGVFKLDAILERMGVHLLSVL